MWIFVWECTCKDKGPKKSEESIGSPGARVIGGCELPGVGTGNQIQSSARALCTPNCWAISPVWAFSSKQNFIITLKFVSIIYLCFFASTQQRLHESLQWKLLAYKTSIYCVVLDKRFADSAFWEYLKYSLLLYINKSTHIFTCIFPPNNDCLVPSTLLNLLQIKRSAISTCPYIFL